MHKSLLGSAAVTACFLSQPVWAQQGQSPAERADQQGVMRDDVSKQFDSLKRQAETAIAVCDRAAYGALADAWTDRAEVFKAMLPGGIDPALLAYFDTFPSYPEPCERKEAETSSAVSSAPQVDPTMDPLEPDPLAQFFAKGINETRREVMFAIEACDRPAYDRLSAKWHNEMDSFQKLNPDPVIYANTTNALPPFPDPCKPKKDGFRVGVTVGTLFEGIKIQSIGTESSIGSGTPSDPYSDGGEGGEGGEGGLIDETSQVIPTEEQKVDVFNLSGTIRLPGSLGGGKLRIGYGEGDSTKRLPDVDPGTLGRLLVPSPGDSNDGLSLGGSSDFPNVATNIEQSLELEQFHIGFEQPIFDFSDWVKGSEVNASFLFRYRDRDYDILTSGDIPGGFQGTFLTHSDISFSQVDLHVSASGKFPLGGSFYSYLHASAGPSFYSLDATDTSQWAVLDLTGGGTATTDESVTEFTSSGTIGLGAEILPGFDINVFGSVFYDTIPVGMVDGTNPKTYDFERDERVFIGVGFDVKF